MSKELIYACAGIALVIIGWQYLNATDIPKIKNLPEIPGVPIFGNLIQLGDQHPRKASEWAKKYGPVFQTRLGNRRVIFANDYESVKHLWVTHQSALISRPVFHTFHSVVSSSQGFTIGTSPWNESCKRRRKAAATALNRPAVHSYMPLLDLESTVAIKELLADSQQGTVDVNPIGSFQRFALSITLALNYGFRMKGNVKDELLSEIIHVEREVSNFRSTSNNWQDYVPMMRMFAKQNSEAIQYRERRHKYMSDLLGYLKDRIAKGTDRPCISGNILKDPDAKLNDAEVVSIGLSMVGGGIDTTPANIIMGVAYLGSAEGQKIQKKAYDAIKEVYPDGDAWEKCLEEEKVPYITALCKEIVRFFTVIPISLPRESIKDIPYGDSVIPAGTAFFMNAWAANFDEKHFKQPKTFWPERYLGVEASGTEHYGFGAGSRMCAGSHLANRELYTVFVRLITAFEFLPPQNPEDLAILDALDCNINPTSLTTDPKPFKVGVRIRKDANVKQWIQESDERTKSL